MDQLLKTMSGVCMSRSSLRYYFLTLLLITRADSWPEFLGAISQNKFSSNIPVSLKKLPTGPVTYEPILGTDLAKFGVSVGQTYSGLSKDGTQIINRLKAISNGSQIQLQLVSKTLRNTPLNKNEYLLIVTESPENYLPRQTFIVMKFNNTPPEFRLTLHPKSTLDLSLYAVSKGSYPYTFVNTNTSTNKRQGNGEYYFEYAKAEVFKWEPNNGVLKTCEFYARKSLVTSTDSVYEVDDSNTHLAKSTTDFYCIIFDGKMIKRFFAIEVIQRVTIMKKAVNDPPSEVNFLNVFSLNKFIGRIQEMDVNGKMDVAEKIAETSTSFSVFSLGDHQNFLGNKKYATTIDFWMIEFDDLNAVEVESLGNPSTIYSVRSLSRNMEMFSFGSDTNQIGTGLTMAVSGGETSLRCKVEGVDARQNVISGFVANHKIAIAADSGAKIIANIKFAKFAPIGRSKCNLYFEQLIESVKTESTPNKRALHVTLDGKIRWLGMIEVPEQFPPVSFKLRISSLPDPGLWAKFQQDLILDIRNQTYKYWVSRIDDKIGLVDTFEVGVQKDKFSGTIIIIPIQDNASSISTKSTTTPAHHSDSAVTAQAAIISPSTGKDAKLVAPPPLNMQFIPSQNNKSALIPCDQFGKQAMGDSVPATESHEHYLTFQLQAVPKVWTFIWQHDGVQTRIKIYPPSQFLANPSPGSISALYDVFTPEKVSGTNIIQLYTGEKPLLLVNSFCVEAEDGGFSLKDTGTPNDVEFFSRYIIRLVESPGKWSDLITQTKDNGSPRFMKPKANTQDG